MEKQVYLLMDTALKIGLGALISGLATYFVARHNSVTDKVKEDRLFKRQILQQAAIKLELAHFKLDESTHPFWANMATKGAGSLAAPHLESLRHNLDARNIISEARALIALLGISPLRKSLLDIERDISTIYEAVARNEVSEEVDEINVMHNNVRNDLVSVLKL